MSIIKVFIRDRWPQRAIWVGAFGFSCLLLGSHLDKEAVSLFAVIWDMAFISFFGYQVYLEFNNTIINVTQTIKYTVELDEKGIPKSFKQVSDEKNEIHIEEVDENNLTN